MCDVHLGSFENRDHVKLKNLKPFENVKNYTEPVDFRF